MIRYYCFTLFIGFISAFAAKAQQDSIDVFIELEMQKRRIPGLQLAVVQNGKIVKTANYGWANVQDSIPVGDKTVFTINSITKAFTGVAILQLAEMGKLKLEAPVSTYLAGLPADWNAITIQQLLSHISGLPDIVDKEESTLISPQGETAAWEMVKTLPLASKPGIRFDYNQTNYLLLGKIIDTLSGMSFRDFIIRHQLEKAVMVKTIRAGFGANKDIVVHAAAGYRYSRGRLQNMFFSLPPSLQTAAGMSSTATELAQWIIALQSGKLLKPSLLKSLWSPAQLKDGTIAGFTDLINGYAAGWPVIVRKNHPAAAPVGGGRAALLVYPDDDLSIIVLTNLAGATPEIFIDDLAAFYLPGIKNSTRAGK